jgi:hypothetical protein
MSQLAKQLKAGANTYSTVSDLIGLPSSLAFTRIPNYEAAIAPNSAETAENLRLQGCAPW